MHFRFESVPLSIGVLWVLPIILDAADWIKISLIASYLEIQSVHFDMVVLFNQSSLNKKKSMKTIYFHFQSTDRQL